MSDDRFVYWQNNIWMDGWMDKIRMFWGKHNSPHESLFYMDELF
jgi:hypothetical protein